MTSAKNTNRKKTKKKKKKKVILPSDEGLKTQIVSEEAPKNSISPN